MYNPFPRYPESKGKHGMERWARTVTASFIGIGNGAARTPEAQELDAGGHNVVQHRPPLLCQHLLRQQGNLLHHVTGDYQSDHLALGFHLEGKTVRL